MEKRQCYKCKHWRSLRYYKDSIKTDDLCVTCNFCRLKQNTYLSVYNHSSKGKKRVHNKAEGPERKRRPYTVQNRKPVQTLLCDKCNNKIGHVVYRTHNQE